MKDQTRPDALPACDRCRAGKHPRSGCLSSCGCTVCAPRRSALTRPAPPARRRAKPKVVVDEEKAADRKLNGAMPIITDDEIRAGVLRLVERLASRMGLTLDA